MTNIQLSSRSDEWYTPSYILDMVHETIGSIDLDPASSPHANLTVKATKYFTRKDNALSIEHWTKVPATVFLNPPGGKLGNKSLTALFWQRLIDLRTAGLLSEAIFMGFSLEHMAVTQSCSLSICNFPLVVPRKRIKFISPEGSFNSPTHSNVIVYIPGIENNVSRFKDVFGQLGAILNPDMPA